MEEARGRRQPGTGGTAQAGAVRAALAANDRLKLYLSVLQAAHDRAQRGDAPALDLARSPPSPGSMRPWLAQLPATAHREGKELHVAGLDRLAGLLAEDPVQPWRDRSKATRTSTRAVRTGAPGWPSSPRTRCRRLAPRAHQRQARQDDSLHLLVMDLHKSLNRLAAELSSETIDGAHVAGGFGRSPRIAAFMRGLNSDPCAQARPSRAGYRRHPRRCPPAAAERYRHQRRPRAGDPGRGSARRAHLLRPPPPPLRLLPVAAVRGRRQLERAAGAPAPAQLRRHLLRRHRDLRPCADEEALCRVLEGIGARIVFPIDWNRARKRLEQFVGKTEAVAISPRPHAGASVTWPGWLSAASSWCSAPCRRSG